MSCLNDVSAHFLILIIILTCTVRADEVFSAVHNLLPLVDTQRIVIEKYEKYIKDEEIRIGNLKKYVARFKKEYKTANADPVRYVTNPINAFSMINRLVSDVNDMGTLTNTTTPNVNLDDCNCTMPTKVDLRGATEALVRLQITYKLQVKHIANGILLSTSKSPMSASDCYVIGKSLFEARDLNDVYTCIHWLLYALKKRSHEDREFREPGFTSVHIMTLLSQAYLYLGNYGASAEWANKIFEKYPNHGDIELKYRHPKKSKYLDSSMIRHYPAYEALCRGEMDVPHEISRSLKCEYLTKHHPFLKIAPIKMERLYIDPEVYLMYDVIYEREIRYLMDSGISNLVRAAVRHDNGTSLMSRARISKSTWLAEELSREGSTILQRFRDFTGLDTYSAESIQIGNYGIGGQYDTHYDFHKNYSLLTDTGNRIATALLYLTDVEQGGATVFPNLGLTVFPLKGAALYWINLHSSGAGDKSTLHAACPVLRGSKWVANKWFHELGQEFRRPCGLKYRGFDFQRTTPKAIPKSLNKNKKKPSF